MFQTRICFDCAQGCRRFTAPYKWYFYNVLPGENPRWLKNYKKTNRNCLAVQLYSAGRRQQNYITELGMDWIYPWIGLDWIGLGGMTVTPFFT